MTTLATDLADGNTSAVISRGGTFQIFMRGNFNSGTAKVQLSVDGTNWVDAGADGELTASGAVILSAKPGVLWRIVGPGAGASITVDYL